MKPIIEIDAETCQICGKYTDWDSSYGNEQFVICPRCMEKAKNQLNFSRGDIIGIICAFARIRKEVMKK